MVRGKARLTLAFVLLAVSAWRPVSFAQPVDALAGEKLAYSVRDLTVQITSFHNQDIAAEGYGFVVAQQGDAVTIVTADHVVRDPDGAEYGQVRVVFYADQAHPEAATVLDLRLPPAYGDLAVLEVRKPGFRMAQPPVARLPLTQGERGWRVAKQRGWTPGNIPGVFTGTELTIWLGFDNLDTPRGSSGGPIVVEQGLVGMVTDDQSGRALVLPINIIANFFHEKGLPWGLNASAQASAFPQGPPASLTDERDLEPDAGRTSCEKQVDDKASNEAVLAADADARVKACAQALEDHPNEPRLIELLQSAHEQQAFQRALRSKERGASLAYLDLYPNGRFADDVKQYLASLTPAPSSPQPLSSVEPLKPKVEQVEAARVLQGELKRVGCDPVSIDGNWGVSSQRALAQFNQQTHSSLDVNVASLEAIEAVRSKTERVCPPTCGPGERLAGDQCLPPACGHGLHLSRSGVCVADLPPQPRAASNPRPRGAAENPSPNKVRAHSAASAARSDCFTFNGERFCN
jgi:hypothetical protein